MRKFTRWTPLHVGIIIMGVLLFAASSLHAQEAPSSPTLTPPQDTQAVLELLLERAQFAAERAEAAAANAEAAVGEAEDAIGLAGDLFGLFEAMSGAVGLVVPFLAVAAGLVGFSRLESAQSELRESRERFERDVQRREAELDALRDELERTAAQQRELATKSSLALALLPLGERQYRAQDYTGALDTYERALQLNPDNPITHYRMGYVYTQSGKFDEAMQHLQRSLELDPEFAPSFATLGYVYRRQADKLQPSIERDQLYNQAEENFLKALNRYPKLMDEDNESWWGSLGGLYRRRGQIEQAIRAYERCTQITPNSSYPFSNLALLYMQTGDRERMMQTYQRVEQLAASEVQADVDNYWAYADLIVSRLALGKYKEVDQILQPALETAPSDSPYTLDSLIDTLNRLAAVLTPQEKQPIQGIIAYIRKFREQREAGQSDILQS